MGQGEGEVSGSQLNMSSQIIAKHELVLHWSNELMGNRLWLITVSPLLSSQFAMEECAQFWVPNFKRNVDTQEDPLLLQIRNPGKISANRNFFFKLGPKDVWETLNVNIFNWNICSLIPHSFQHSLLFYIQYSHITVLFCDFFFYPNELLAIEFQQFQQH